MRHTFLRFLTKTALHYTSCGHVHDVRILSSLLHTTSYKSLKMASNESNSDTRLTSDSHSGESFDLSKVKPQQFDYFLILDFEATCDNQKKIRPQEIIELPVLKINAKTLQTESVFHQYVEPRVNKELTAFCVELTGIIQDMVNGQPHLEEVLEKFHDWMNENQLLDPNVTSIFVTCGDWDLKSMLQSQSRYFNIPIQPYFKQWINIKKSFSDVTSIWPKGMMPMLSELGISHQGRHHSGIDDCRNIGNIVRGLLQRGYVFKTTVKLS